LADLQRTVYPHSGHPSSEGRAQDSVSSPAKDRRSANCAMQPTFQSYNTSHVHDTAVFISVSVLCSLSQTQHCRTTHCASASNSVPVPVYSQSVVS